MIAAALERGADVLFTPGVYHLEGPIRVTRPDTVLFGLGYPTLVADKGAVVGIVHFHDLMRIGAV